MKQLLLGLSALVLLSASDWCDSAKPKPELFFNGNQKNLITHSHYTLEYSEEHEQAIYVTYLLTKERLESEKVKRSDDFREDPLVKTGSATLTDYKGSGYDRGHLCPAGDMTFSKTAMSESFFMSNMSPQAPSFNRGIWKKLEEQVRDWSMKHDELYVYTGPLLDSIIGYIGPDSVAVPYRYFKTIYAPKLKTGIGFILKNEKSSDELGTKVVSIDSVESILDRDLYSGLPKRHQKKFEQNNKVELFQ